MSSNREREIILCILKMYKEMPYLWRQDHKDYSKREARERGFRALLDIFKEINSDATMKMIKKKLENMRTCFHKEHKKVIYAKKNGQEYVPTLWYYYEMAFIKDKHKPKNETEFDDDEATDDGMDRTEWLSEESISANDETIEAPETTNSSVFVEEYAPEEKFSFVTTTTVPTTVSQDIPSSSKERKERTSKPAKRPRGLRDSSYDHIMRNLDEEECDSFGRSVALQLRKMYVENALLAQSRIQTILTEIGISDHRQKAAEKQVKYYED